MISHTNEKLPLENSLKDVLKVYWNRLLVFLVVSGVSLLLVILNITWFAHFSFKAALIFTGLVLIGLAISIYMIFKSRHAGSAALSGPAPNENTGNATPDISFLEVVITDDLGETKLRLERELKEAGLLEEITTQLTGDWGDEYIDSVSKKFNSMRKPITKDQLHYLLDILFERPAFYVGITGNEAEDWCAQFYALCGTRVVLTTLRQESKMSSGFNTRLKAVIRLIVGLEDYIVSARPPNGAEFSKPSHISEYIYTKELFISELPWYENRFRLGKEAQEYRDGEIKKLRNILREMGID